jgi:hypothetical protein
VSARVKVGCLVSPGDGIDDIRSDALDALRGKSAENLLLEILASKR